MFGEKKLYSAVLHFLKHFRPIFNWRLFKLGSVSVRDIRKNVPILLEEGSNHVPAHTVCNKDSFNPYLQSRSYKDFWALLYMYMAQIGLSNIVGS